MCKNDHDRKDEKSRAVVGMGYRWGSGFYSGLFLLPKMENIAYIRMIISVF